MGTVRGGAANDLQGMAPGSILPLGSLSAHDQEGLMSKRKPQDPEALRGRILLVFQHEIRITETRIAIAFYLKVSDIARELGVSRQRVYRAVPELKGR